MKSLFAKKKSKSPDSEPSVPPEISHYHGDHDGSFERSSSESPGSVKKMAPDVKAAERRTTGHPPDEVSSKDGAAGAKPKLVFHCQQAQGSPTGLISGFTSVRELYQKIADCFDMQPSEVRPKIRNFLRVFFALFSRTFLYFILSLVPLVSAIISRANGLKARLRLRDTAG